MIPYIAANNMPFLIDPPQLDWPSSRVSVPWIGTDPNTRYQLPVPTRKALGTLASRVGPTRIAKVSPRRQATNK